MKGRQWEPDVAKVSIAVLQCFLAGGTFAHFAGSALTLEMSVSCDWYEAAVDETHQLRIEGSMAVRGAIVFNIVKESVRDFGDGLVRNVLIGSVCNAVMVSQQQPPTRKTSSSPYWMPNLMPRKRLGRLSTSCFLTEFSVECAIAPVAER